MAKETSPSLTDEQAEEVVGTLQGLAEPALEDLIHKHPSSNLMKHIYLPPKKGEKNFTLYSPIGIKALMGKAVDEEAGDIEAVLTKSKYKQVREMWHASPLMVLFYKKFGKKFFAYPSDNPDIHLVSSHGGNQEGFGLEVTSFYDFVNKQFVGDYERLVKKVWDDKDRADYDEAELLIVSRLSGEINVSQLIREIQKYEWKTHRIWLGFYKADISTWGIFEVVPGDPRIPVVENIKIDELPY